MIILQLSKLLALVEMVQLSLSVPQYHLGTDFKNYDEAKGGCIRHLGDEATLAMPKTKAEADAVEKLITDSKNDLKPPQLINVANDKRGSGKEKISVVYLGATGEEGNTVWDDGSRMGPPLFSWRKPYWEKCQKVGCDCITRVGGEECVGLGEKPGEPGFKLSSIPCDKYKQGFLCENLDSGVLKFDFTTQYLCQAPELRPTTTTEAPSNTTTILVVMCVCVVVLMGIGFLMYKKWTSDSDRARRRRMMLGGGDGDTDTSGLSGMSLGSSSSSRMSSLRGRSSRGSFSSFRGSSRASSRTSFGSRGSSSSLGSRGSRGSRRSKSSFSSTGSRGSKRSFRARGSSTSVGTEM